jgi:hypothetical protein
MVRMQAKHVVSAVLTVGRIEEKQDVFEAEMTTRESGTLADHILVDKETAMMRLID